MNDIGACLCPGSYILSIQVSSVEDAKSEIVKIFQEAWEKEHGFEWEDQGPPIQRYAEDILRA